MADNKNLNWDTKGNPGRGLERQSRMLPADTVVSGEKCDLQKLEVGRVAIANTYDIQTKRTHLLDTVKEGAELFNATLEEINSGRNKKQRIPISSPDLLREQAEDWLTDERVIATTALPETSQRKCVIFPRLNRPIAVTEIVDAWSSVSEYGLYGWSDRLKFLGKIAFSKPDNYNSEQIVEHGFVVIPTAYDTNREGAVVWQNYNLITLQQDFPKIDVTTLFEGSLLARKYKDQRRTWKDSYVRDIGATPIRAGVFDYVSSAYVDAIGYACVSASNLCVERAARLRVV